MKKTYKKLACLIIFSLIFQISFPTISYALSSGPSQPEYSGFSQVGVSDLVDHATGDFNYSLPLLELPANSGSLPIVLNYAGVTNQEQEASNVGLGWNLNIGHINRDVIGYPDDFDKEEIVYRQDRKTNRTISVTGGADFEVLGLKGDKVPKLSFGRQVSVMWNSYVGLGFSIGNSISGGKGVFSGSVGAGYSSIDGHSMNSSVSLLYKEDKKSKAGIGLSYNSGALGSAVNLNTSIGESNGSFSYESPNLTFPREFDYYGTSLGYAAQLGGEIWYSNGNLSQQINVSREDISNKNKDVTMKASGAFYHDQLDFEKDNDVDMDYRRDGEFQLHENTKQLPFPIVNKDKFSINTPFFNDAFTVSYANFESLRKPRSSTLIGGLNLSAQADVGNLGNAGIDGEGNITHSVNNPNRFKNFTDRGYNYNKSNTDIDNTPSKYWLLESNNGLNKGNGHSIDTDTDNILQKESYLYTPFKSNASFSQNDIFQSSKFKQNGKSINYQDLFIERSDENLLKEYTNEDVISLHHFSHPFWDVKYSTSFGGPVNTNVSRRFGKKKISAFHYQKGNGMKFFFGLPVLNLSKEEYILGTEEEGQYNCNRITVDEEQFTRRNDERFLDIVKTPAYAESFLLTTVVGPDFVNRDVNDGLPNVHDQGFWVNYEYTKTNDSEDPYIWRIPFAGANVDEGVVSDSRDNKANFIVGEREQYYVNKIKSATHEIVFNYSNRSDNRGAAEMYQNDPNHGATTRQINSIELWSLQDHVLLKTVHLKYKPTGLCLGAENSPNGKLTLEEVYFTNYNSTLGASYPYTFDYYDSPYLMNVTKDRWGFNKESCTPFDFAAKDYSNGLPIWHLRNITMPSGASIEVKLSRDHYNSVETLKPAKMFKIKALGNKSGTKINSDDPYRVYFDLEGSSNIDDYLSDLYKDGAHKQVYFNLQTDILNNTNIERVDGYAYISNSGIENNLGFIELLPMEYRSNEDESFHPFLVMTWHKLRNTFRKLMYSGIILENVSDLTLEEFLANLNNAFFKTRDHYKTCIQQGYGEKIDLNNSYIRLTNPTNFKIGGDLKVDKIIYSVGDDINPNYGFSYDYTIIEEDGSVASSGNVPSEPALGSFANPDKYAIEVVNSAMLAKNEARLFQELPVNKNHLLSSKVKYERVTVKSLASDLMEKISDNESVDVGEYGLPGGLDLASLNLSSTGKTVYQFYTSKDFPTINRTSPVLKRAGNNIMTWLLLYVFVPVQYAYAQGYYVERNNMHGKLKSENKFSQSKTGKINTNAIFSKHINYNTKEVQIKWGDTNKNALRLDNFIKVNNIFSQHFNTDYSTAVDLKYAISSHSEIGGDYNMDLSVAPPPVPAPTFWPAVSIRNEKLATSVVNQTCYKKGIVSSIIVKENNAEIETFHDNYNQYTGQPEQIMVENEFDELNVSLSTKTYEKYPLAGPASKNHYYSSIKQKQDLVQLDLNCQANCQLDILSGDKIMPGDFLIIRSLTPEGKEISGMHTFARVLNKVDNTVFMNIDYWQAILGTDQVKIETLVSGYSNQLNSNVKQRTLIKAEKSDLDGALISESVTAYGAGWNTLNTGRVGAQGDILLENSIVYENNYLPTYQFSKADNRPQGTDITSSDLSRSGAIGTSSTNSFGTIDDSYLGTKTGAVSPVLNKISATGIPLESVDRNYVYQANLVSSVNKDNIAPFQGIKASANNSSYYETAFESFEDQEDQYGLHFDYSGKESQMMKSYHIIRKEGNMYILNERYSNMASKLPHKGLFYGTKGVDRVETFVNINNIEPFADSESGEELTAISISTDNCTPLLDEGENLQLHLFFSNPNTRLGTRSSIDSNVSHTGKSSLEVASETRFSQNDLLLVEDKEYWVSCWVLPITDEESGFEVLSDQTIYTLNPIGDPINGWQKVEGKFLGSNLITLQSFNNISHIDDIRIHAYNGSMQSFVYNDRQQLEYILDENNFFSQYHYDGEGRLFGISKETEKGIRTISEQRQYTQK